MGPLSAMAIYRQHLYWMWRQGVDYGQFEKVGSTRESPEIAMVSRSPSNRGVRSSNHDRSL